MAIYFDKPPPNEWPTNKISLSWLSFTIGSTFSKTVSEYCLIKEIPFIILRGKVKTVFNTFKVKDSCFCIKGIIFIIVNKVEGQYISKSNHQSLNE